MQKFRLKVCNSLFSIDLLSEVADGSNSGREADRSLSSTLIKFYLWAKYPRKSFKSLRAILSKYNSIPYFCELCYNKNLYKTMNII